MLPPVSFQLLLTVSFRFLIHRSMLTFTTGEEPVETCLALCWCSISFLVDTSQNNWMYLQYKSRLIFQVQFSSTHILWFCDTTIGTQMRSGFITQLSRAERTWMVGPLAGWLMVRFGWRAPLILQLLWMKKYQLVPAMSQKR